MKIRATLLATTLLTSIAWGAEEEKTNIINSLHDIKKANALIKHGQDMVKMCVDQKYQEVINADFDLEYNAISDPFKQSIYLANCMGAKALSHCQLAEALNESTSTADKKKKDEHYTEQEKYANIYLQAFKDQKFDSITTNEIGISYCVAMYKRAGDATGYRARNYFLDMKIGALSDSDREKIPDLFERTFQYYSSAIARGVSIPSEKDTLNQVRFSLLSRYAEAY